MEMRILQPTEIVAKRPFTHPRHTAQDLVAFRYMIDQPCLLLETPDRYAHLEPPYILFQTEADGRQQRFVISKTEQFAVPNRPLTVVGFWSKTAVFR